MSLPAELEHMDKLNLKVSAIEDLTPAIRKFELVAASGGQLPDFLAGAHIDIDTGAGVVRSYSLANDPADKDHYVLAVLREAEGGGGSRWMHDSVGTGDLLNASGPVNDFPLDQEAERHLLIAGGIGITPLLAMGHELSRGETPFHLHYCTKSAGETAFLDEVRQVFGENITFHHDGGDPSKGMDLESELKDRPEGAHFIYLRAGRAVKRGA